jgi:phosphoglycolate phosphatase-like HAD superfamily hydrolase
MKTMIEGTTWLVVDALWEANKDSFWELGDNCHQVTLTQMLSIYGGESLPEVLELEDEEDDEEKDQEAKESLEADLHRHLETLAFWDNQLSDYEGAEEEIPLVWALTVEADLNVEDGNHRLLVAHLLGLETYPCTLVENNPEKRVLFLDLDETLLRTTSIDDPYGANQIFLGNPPWAIRKTDEYKAQTRRYPAVLKAYDEGNPRELIAWAKQRGVKFLPNYPYITRLRPGVIPFLESVNEMFDEVNILTAGAREFQKEVIQAHGIEEYFDNVYGREDTAQARFDPPHGTGPLTTSYAILVDDNGNFGSMGWNAKMTAIGVLDKEPPRGSYAERDEYYARVAQGHFLPITCWFGRDSDTALGDVLNELRGLV